MFFPFLIRKRMERKEWTGIVEWNEFDWVDEKQDRLLTFACKPGVAGPNLCPSRAVAKIPTRQCGNHPFPFDLRYPPYTFFLARSFCFSSNGHKNVSLFRLSIFEPRDSCEYRSVGRKCRQHPREGNNFSRSFCWIANFFSSDPRSTLVSFHSTILKYEFTLIKITKEIVDWNTVYTFDGYCRLSMKMPLRPPVRSYDQRFWRMYSPFSGRHVKRASGTYAASNQYGDGQEH